MSIYKAPDGSKYNIPSDPNERVQFVAAVKEKYGQDIDQTTVLGRAAELPKGIARGAIGLGLDVPLGIASLFDVGDDGKIVKGLQSYKKKIREESPLAAEPGYEDLWTTKLSEGLGSFVPFLGVGLAGRALTQAPKPFFSKGYFKTPEFTLPLALSVPTGVAQQADRVQMAREMGEDVGGISETIAELAGGIIGISEILPIGALLARTSKTALKDYALRDKIKSALLQGTQEGAQEVFASLAQDLTARGLYSDELPIGESLADEFTIGGVIGAGADLVVNSFAGRRGIGNENLKQREAQLRQNRIQLQDEKRFDKAVEQGLVEEIQPVEVKDKPDIPIPIGEIQPLPNFEIIQDTQGNFNLLDTSKEGSPVLKTFEAEAEAIVAKEKELNKLRVKNLKIDIENALYNQGLINSASGFDLGVTLLDPNSIQLNPQSILNFDSKVKKVDRKDIESYFTNKKVDLKPTYSMQEVRKILAPKDLNRLQSDMAQQIFRQSEKRGEPSIRDDKSQVNVNNKYIKEIAASKNIELDFKDPAVQHFTREVTGYDDISKVKNRGAKELFLARLHSLPKFNFKTKLPDFRPRQYSAEDMANFVANMGINNTEFSVADLLKAGPTAGNKPATEQFVRDLTTSGRANKVEGTNKYKINKNYEFEVARKAEGFNETPEEFGERLVREGILPQETIDQLIEAEKVRQEKYLPPKEVAPKMINFAQSVEEGRVNKFAQEARKILDKAGLKETGVIISDDILSTTSLVQTPDGVIKRDPKITDIAEAEYDRDTDIVFVSLNAVNPDGLATDAEIQQRINRIIDHEMIHALRNKDLINEQEYQYLRQEVKRRKVPESVDATAFNNKETYYARSKRINTQVEQTQRGKDYQEEIYVEEAIAELYRNRFSQPAIPKKAETIFEKITQFFKSLGQAFRRSGFDKSSDIFRAIEEGEVGKRQRGEIRTLREIDRVPLADELQPIVEIDETRPRTPYTTIGVNEDGNEVIISTTPIEQFPGSVPSRPLTGLTLRPRAGVGGPDATPVGEVYDVDKLTPEEYLDTKNFILDNYKKIYKDVPKGVRKDGRKFLQWMRDNAPNEDYKMISSKVLETLNKLANAGIDTFIEIKALPRGRRGQNAYSPLEGQNTVSVANRRDSGRDDGINYETILHEFIHSATVPIIYKRKLGGLNKKADKLFKNLEEIQEKFATEISSRWKNLRDKIEEYQSTGNEDIALELDKLILEPAEKYLLEGSRYIDNGKFERITSPLNEDRLKGRMRELNFRILQMGRHFIGYQTYGLQEPKGKTFKELKKNKQADLSEFLTFGFTNRQFQELLESVDFVPKKQSAWSKFVDSIREFIGLPVKANTALSGFLENASTLVDIAAIEPSDVLSGQKDVIITTSDRQSLDDEINKLGTQIYNLERRAEADRQYLSNDAYNQDMRRIGNLKARQEDLIRQRAELPPEQPPLFSRTTNKLKKIESGLYEYRGFAIEDLQQRAGAPYKVWGFGKIPEGKDVYSYINEDSANSLKEAKEFIDRVYFNETDVPLFSRAQDIGSPLNEPLSYRLNDRTLERWLKYHNYENLNERPGAPRTEGEIDAAYRRNDPALNESYVLYPDRVETFFAPTGDKLSKKTYKNPTHRQLLVDFDYIPRTQEADISKRFESYDGDVPTFSRAQLKVEPIRRVDQINMDADEVSNIAEFARRSRIAYNKKLKTIPLDLVNKYPKLRELSLKNLRKLLNKNGNLVVYRSLNLSENEEIINNGQLPDDPFASTTLDSKYAQTIGKDIAVQNVINTKLINRLYKDNKISESDYKVLTTQSLDMFDRMDKDAVITKLRNEGIELIRKFERPINVLRYEIPLDRVILHMPIIPSIIKNDLKEVADRMNSEGGGTIEPDYNDYVQDGMTEEQIEDGEIEYEDDLLSYNSEIDSLTSEIEDGLLNMEEESEVIANLDGITPTYIYKPTSGELEFKDTFRRGKRFAKESNTSENKKLVEATERVEEIVKSTPNGEIPPVNPNASDVAFKAFLDFNDTSNTSTPPDDIPTFSVGAIPEEYQDQVDKIGYTEPRKSFGARMIDFTSDPISNIKNSFKFVRTQLIDKLDLIDKKITQAIEDNDEVRANNNTADTATMAALRMADRARGLFQGMLTRGFVSDSVKGEDALANVNDLELSTVYNPYIEGDTGTGGLMQIISPLYADPTVNREFLFKLYATSKRTENFDKNGQLVESPLTREKAQENIRNIEQNYPSVVEVYNNYQNWNNQLITFAENKGLLDPQQAKLWREHSAYYPFYRKMVDEENILGPRIAAGSLPNNPLSIQITGSENPLDVDPIEAIARNSLSILTAALKNDGTSKLLRDLQAIGSAKRLESPDEIKRASQNRIFVFENGQKTFYSVEDPELFYGLQSVGGMNTDFITKILAMPASILRDTVTRDPGFVVVNILRDTLSSAVTSGAPIGADGFRPVIDSFKNMFEDMENLEKFGVLGGYDFQNDEGTVKQFIDRSMRQEGLMPDNSASAQDMFFKLWDGLGALTTKSDGATRKAVYDSVYKDLIKRGYTEAQAQSEAAYQALEIINFGRRGLSPMFRTITAAIPFLNARIQGLDVLFRSFTGKYSAVEKLQEGETREDVRKRILKTAITRGGFLMALTAMYYMMVSDDEEYQGLRREIRDDNWIIPLVDGIPALKIPIPFEVGMIFKTFPERFIDEFMGREIEPEPLTSVKRQLGTSAKVPFFDGGLGFQLLKPIAEVYQNRNTFTNTEIVPYYQQKLEAGLQSRRSTNELLRVVGETFNVSPAKLEHLFRGYTGTLGGYVLDVADVTARSVTGTPLIPPNLNSIPVLRRLLQDIDRSGGGLQQQFYELRSEVDTAVQTMNKLRKDERFDEYSAYRSNMQGVLNIKGQVRSIERYMDNWRKRRDRLLRRTDISPTARGELLKQMELERDRRLAIVPELRDRANIPVIRGV